MKTKQEFELPGLTSNNRIKAIKLYTKPTRERTPAERRELELLVERGG